MDRYSPCHPQRNLTEGSDDVLTDFTRLLIKLVLRVRPLHRSHIHALSFLIYNGNDTIGNLLYPAQLAIIVVAFRVIPYEYHLRARLELEFLLRRVRMLWKITLDLGDERIRIARKFSHLAAVHLVGAGIMSSQSDRFGAVIHTRRLDTHTFIKLCQQGVRQSVLPDSIEDFQKIRIFLAMHLLELYSDI